MKLSGPVQLIKKSFEIFFKKENLLYFLKIYLILAPFSIAFLFESKLFDGKSLPWGITFGILGLVYVLVEFFVMLAGIKAVSNVIDGKKLGVKETFSYAWTNLWPFSLVAILIFLAVFGGILLLIIPGIIFGIWFSFSEFTFVDKKLGVIDSMKKSRELVRGKFWAVLGRLFVFGLFTGVFGALVSAVPYIGSVTTTIFGALFVLPSFLLYRELAAAGKK